MSDTGVQNLLRVAGVHREEEAFGKFRTDPSSRGGDAFSSADQKVRQQGDLFAFCLAQIVSLRKDKVTLSLKYRKKLLYSPADGLFKKDLK